MSDNLNPVQNPVPASPTPAPVPLTPEQKAARKKEMLRRLKIIGPAAFGALLLFIYVWGFTAGAKDFTFFKYLGTKQKSFDGLLMTLLHIQYALMALSALIATLVFLFKSLTANNQDLQKKKMLSKKAMIGGGVFFGIAALWLVSIIFLGPKLVPEVGGGIVTDPANTIGLTAPVEVSFDASRLPIDTDTVQILSYTWYFGDGATSNGSLAMHRYTKKGSADGKYTVKLSVGLEDLITKQEFTQEFKTEVVIVNESTSASFTMSRDSGEIPLKVKFDGSSSNDPDGEIVSYEWDLDGDGQFDDALAVAAEYTYTQEGTFAVSLKVTDNNGASNIATQEVDAGTVNGLRAIINSDVGADEIYFVGEKYTFSGELSQIKTGNISKYTWDFGDGSSKTQSKTTTHSFSKAGTYSIKLTIQDLSGNQDTQMEDVKVVDKGSPPVAKITSTPKAENDRISGPVPLEVNFDASGSTDVDGDIVQYAWDFDNDGETDDSGDRVTYTYTKEGNYTAKVILTDSAGNVAEDTIPVTVTAQGIVARFSADKNNGEVPLTVSFDSSASSYKDGEIVSYTYDFGDGSKPYIGGSGVTYKYSSVGNFAVTLTVTGGDGKTDSSTIQVVVRPVSITACFTVNTESGTAPLYVAVDPSCSKGAIKSYSWEFGDGDISFDRMGGGIHTYSNTGTYTIKLEVAGDTGVISTISKNITVE